MGAAGAAAGGAAVGNMYAGSEGVSNATDGSGNRGSAKYMEAFSSPRASVAAPAIPPHPSASSSGPSGPSMPSLGGPILDQEVDAGPAPPSYIDRRDI